MFLSRKKKPGVDLTSTGGDTPAATGHTAKDFGWTEKPKTWSASPADKQKFVDNLYPLVKPIADKLGMPPENLIGLAALESKWGTSHLSIGGNNLFGVQGRPPYSTGEEQALTGPAKDAVFPSYEAALQSFAEKYGSAIQGAIYPDTMATVLQNVGHFGYEDGKPKAGYPHDVAVTVNNLPPQTLK